MIVIIDNYDSFVHNLARYARELGTETMLYRNDTISVDEVLALNPEAVILSPGPCTPQDAGICCDLLKAAPHIPMLGVCLGHQCMADIYDGATIKAKEPMHGRASVINHDGNGLFKNLPSPMKVARYHSLIAQLSSKTRMIVTARSGQGEIMAMHHETFPHYGVQFHPESILTPDGKALLQNFLTIARAYKG